MQFNSSIIVREIEYSEFGGVAQKQNTVDKIIKCEILSDTWTKVKEDKAQYKKYALEFFAPAKAFEPYSKLAESSKIVFIYNGKTYAPVVVDRIKGFMGATRYYEIACEPV